MCRGERRFQHKRVWKKRIRIIWTLSGPSSRADFWDNCWYYRKYKKKYFQDQWHHFFMTTPSWWTREHMIQPARKDSKRKLKTILKGIDAENILWADYKRPHIYYW
jgi:hypothetical protein